MVQQVRDVQMMDKLELDTNLLAVFMRYGYFNTTYNYLAFQLKLTSSEYDYGSITIEFHGDLYRTIRYYYNDAYRSFDDYEAIISNIKQKLVDYVIIFIEYLNLLIGVLLESEQVEQYEDFIKWLMFYIPGV